MRGLRHYCEDNETDPKRNRAALPTPWFRLIRAENTKSNLATEASHSLPVICWDVSPGMRQNMARISSLFSQAASHGGDVGGGSRAATAVERQVASSVSGRLPLPGDSCTGLKQSPLALAAISVRVGQPRAGVDHRTACATLTFPIPYMAKLAR